MRFLGIDLAWREATPAKPADDTLLFVDAPLLVDTPTGQRSCDRQVGQCYGRRQVSANTINLGSPYLAGARLRENLEVGAGHLMWVPSS